MSIKISELPLAGTVSGTELVPIVQDGTTSQISLSQLGSVIPSTAKLYLPDFDTFIPAVLDIVDNFGLTGVATYSENSLWSTFTASNVSNITDFLTITDVYVGGFYNEVEYTIEGGDVLNYGYSGLMNFNAVVGDPNPDYIGSSIYFNANIDTDTYEVLDRAFISFKSDVELSYNWEILGDEYISKGIISGVITQDTILTFDIQVNPVSDSVTWTIGILP